MPDRTVLNPGFAGIQVIQLFKDFHVAIYFLKYIYFLFIVIIYLLLIIIYLLYHNTHLPGSTSFSHMEFEYFYISPSVASII